MSTHLEERLSEFARKNRFVGKGALSVAIFITDLARTRTFPIDPELLISTSGGQVAGLSSGSVQRVLRRCGIERILSNEGGRTNRGSIGNMRAYVALLNALAAEGILDVEEVERFWTAQVEAYFATKPFKLHIDRSDTLRLVARGILEQAKERQRESTGTNYVGAVMQHLVGAKLDCVLGKGALKHHSFSTSDDQTGRTGDFLVGETSIHVTSTPTAALIRKCRANLERGLRPVIVTSDRGIGTVELLADPEGLLRRIEVFEFEQFLALNFYELGRFGTDGQYAAVNDVIERYNEIVAELETDPSLRIMA